MKAIGRRAREPKPAPFVEPDADTLAKAHAVHAASCLSWLRWEQLSDASKAEFCEAGMRTA
jgi:hypothetical protein